MGFLKKAGVFALALFLISGLFNTIEAGKRSPTKGGMFSELDSLLNADNNSTYIDTLVGAASAASAAFGNIDLRGVTRAYLYAYADTAVGTGGNGGGPDTVIVQVSTSINGSTWGTWTSLDSLFPTAPVSVLINLDPTLLGAEALPYGVGPGTGAMRFRGIRGGEGSATDSSRVKFLYQLEYPR